MYKDASKFQVGSDSKTKFNFMLDDDSRKPPNGQKNNVVHDQPSSVIEPLSTSSKGTFKLPDHKEKQYVTQDFDSVRGTGNENNNQLLKMYEMLQVQNKQQQEMIDLLKQTLVQRDTEIMELRRIVNPHQQMTPVPKLNSRINSSPAKRNPLATPIPFGKNFVVQNKLKVLKKSIEPSEYSEN